MKKNLRFTCIFAFVLLAAMPVLAQNSNPTNDVIQQQYEAVSNLKNRSERQEFVRRQTPEMLVALWNEHFNRKIKQMDLSKEQIAHIEKVRSLVTVEFVKSARGSSPYDKMEFIAFNNAMSEAFALFTKPQITELFYILGDINTLISK